MADPDRLLALDLLRRSGWMAGQTPALADALLAQGRLVRLDPGRWVHGEGDQDAGVILVVQGALDLFCQAPGDREVRVGHAGSGAAFGQTTRFGGGPRLVTAVAAVPSLLLIVSDGALDRIARDHPDVWRAVAALVYAQLRGALQMAAEAVALPPRQRLAGRLAMLSRGRPAELALSQQALAEMAGVARKTANACLADFRRAGLVALSYGRISVLNPSGLQRIAGEGSKRQ